MVVDGEAGSDKGKMTGCMGGDGFVLSLMWVRSVGMLVDGAGVKWCWCGYNRLKCRQW